MNSTKAVLYVKRERLCAALPNLEMETIGMQLQSGAVRRADRSLRRCGR